MKKESSINNITSHDAKHLLSDSASKVDFKQSYFSIICPTCYAFIDDIQEVVAIGVTGRPIESELKRMFRKLKLNAKECPYCGEKKLVMSYSYKTKDFPIDDDLPF